MGIVIGPINQSANERYNSWFLLRELRSDVKWMRGEDPVRFSSAINKEEQTFKEEFAKYVVFN